MKLDRSEATPRKTKRFGHEFARINTNRINDPATKFADRRIAGFALYNPLYNLSGQPAITLPLEVSKDGLPIGIMFGARYADEATLLQLAGQLEAARPWIDRRPKLMA